MQITAPIWHAGLFAIAAIPVIIYLIFRRRKKDVPWGSMYLLRKLLETKNKVNVWKQYLIIALRTIVLALLAFAFLFPRGQRGSDDPGEMPSPPASTHRIILLDVSGSMDAQFATGTCFDAAVSLCRKTLGADVYPGRVDILPLDGRSEAISFEQLPVDDAAIEQFVGTLERGEGPADFEAGLYRAIEIARASHHANKEVIVLSDFTARDLSNLPQIAGLIEAVRDQGAVVYTLSYANEAANNSTIFDMTPGIDTLLAGQPTIFYVTLGYFGNEATHDTWLSIRDSEGESLYDESITLAPGRKTVEVYLSLPAGTHTITATLKEDDFASDNAVSRTFTVSPVLNLLVAQDINLSTGFDNPREWLSLALDAKRGAGGVNEFTAAFMNRTGQEIATDTTALAKDQYVTQVDFVNTSQLDVGVMANRDGVIMLDIDSVSEEAVEAARRYAVRGGMVLLAPGPTASPEKFNETFGPLLPAAIGKPVRETIDPDVYESALLDVSNDPLLRELESPQHGNIGSSRFYNWYAVDPAGMTADAQVLFSLSDGSPLLVMRPMGRGGVLLWTAGLGMQWQSMVVHAAYPVFFSRMFNIAAAQRRFHHNLEAGGPIIAEVAQQEADMVTPDGARVTLAATRAEERWLVRFDRTQSPGTYALQADKADPENLTAYHVVEDRGESDYRSIDADAKATIERVSGSPVQPSEVDLFAAMRADYPGRSWVGTLAGIMLALLLLQAYLARRWFA